MSTPGVVGGARPAVAGTMLRPVSLVVPVMIPTPVIAPAPVVVLAALAAGVRVVVARAVPLPPVARVPVLLPVSMVRSCTICMPVPACSWRSRGWGSYHVLSFEGMCRCFALDAVPRALRIYWPVT